MADEPGPSLGTAKKRKDDDPSSTRVSLEPPKKRIKLNINPIHDDFKYNDGEKASVCNHCGFKLKGKNSSTLQKHLQCKHPQAYKLYQDRHALAIKEAESNKAKQVSVNPPKTGSKNNMAVQSALGRTAPITSYMTGFMSGKKYSHDDPRQKSFNEDVAFLVASSTLPVSFTSLPAFKKLIHDLNPHIVVPEQTKLKKEMNEMWEKVCDAIEEGIRVARKIALTTDVWTSKNMQHSYLGVTVHYFNPISRLRSANKVACREFPNPHTGEAIAKLIVDICQEYGMNSKVNYIFADNGSNMVKSYRFMNGEGEDNVAAEEEFELESVDLTEGNDDDLFEGLEEEEVNGDSDEENNEKTADQGLVEDEVDEEIEDFEKRDEEVVGVLKRRGKRRGRCYSHTQQLPINKVNKQRNVAFGKVLAKTKKYVAAYRKSSKAKCILRKTSFKKSLLGFCKTRWYSDLAMTKSVVEAAEMEDKPLAKLSSEMNWAMQINAADLKVLKQYQELMEPFAKHTDVLGGEHYSTLHMVYPALQDLFSHLEEMTKKYENMGRTGSGAAKYCKSLEKEMKKYFGFVLDTRSDSFDPVYFLATFLDPVYSAILSIEQREIAVDHLKTLMIKQMGESGLKDWKEVFENGPGANQVAAKSPVFRGFKHVSKMLANVSHAGSSGSTPFSRDLEKYRSDSERIRHEAGSKSGGEAGPDTENNNGDTVVDAAELEEVAMDDPLDYWVEQEAKFETCLALVAEDILIIPATSTPSERLFSVSGMLSSGKMSNISPQVWCNISKFP